MTAVRRRDVAGILVRVPKHSPGSPKHSMSQMGHNAKYSLRADIFRSSTENGHPRQAYAFAKLHNGEAYR
jgi:hypothetical protein